MEKQKLIYVESKALFSPSEVSDKAIVFIEDTKEIWTHGVYFSCSGAWANPITLTLSGDSTGSVSIDGSGNVTLSVTNQYLGVRQGGNDANSALSPTHKIQAFKEFAPSFANGFPATNYANAIININTHLQNYDHQLGFSSNKGIYHRTRNGGVWDSSWEKLLTSTNYTNYPHTFASLTNKPTTISGYGITDCIPIIKGGLVTTDTDLSTLGMTTLGAKLSVFHLYEGPYPSWLNVPYMNVLMFRSTIDSYGAIGIEMTGRTVLFTGGRNLETVPNNAPNWWYRIKGNNGTTYDLNSFLNVINNLDGNYLRKSGGIMTGSITLNRGAYLTDGGSGYGLLGIVNSGNSTPGMSSEEGLFINTPLILATLRTSGNNLWHYNHANLARYLILDTNNYSTYALPLSGGTMKGALNFANNTWNKVGDDAYIGDCNVAGMIGIKGSNAATPGFAMYNNSGTLLGKLYASGSNLYWSGVKLLTSTGSAQEAYLAWGGQNLANNSSPIDTILEPSLGANRLAFLSPDAINIEYSQDGGTTWLNYSATDAQKVSLFCGGGNYSNFYLGGNSSTDPSIDRTPWRLRITISVIGYSLYCQFIKFLIYTTDVGNTTYCLLLGRKYSDYQNNVDTWVTFLTARIAGWSGWNTINHPNGIILPHTANYAQLRFEFYMTSLGTTGRASIISRIEGFAHKCWSWPSNMAGYGNIYSYDWQLNVTFPAKVTTTGGFSGNLTGDVTGNLTGNADTASNISTVNPILALPFEKNTIQVVSNPLGALAELLGTAAAITHALRFNWYDTAYEIGNVRGGASNSLGFGITYGNNNLCLLVKTNGTYSPYGFIGSLSGNASTASKWKDARTITLTGDVTGSVTLDGSSNVTLTTTTTSGTGTTSFLKCPDKRNSYPALIVTSGGNIGAAFISTSTLGLSEGYYCDTLILRGYATHTAGYENALFFNKQNSSVYHSQYAFGSTTTWGTMYKFLDSNNYSSYALPLSGGTMTGNIILTTGKWIADSTTSTSILGTFASGNSTEGLYSEAGVLVGKTATQTTLSSNGDDLWHYRNSDKTRYKILDAANYTNYTIGYANDWRNHKGYAGVISDGKLYYNNTLQFARFVQHDNSGRFSYELIAELTNYGTGTNTSYITYGISGFMWALREGNGANSGAYPITAIVNVGPAVLLNMLRVPVTTDALIPFVVKYNDKYYIALRKNGSSTVFYFMGILLNLLTTTIIVDDASLIEEIAGPITETSTSKYYYNNGTPQEYLHAGNYKNFYPIKLLYPRTFWGLSFDGSANVNGAINIVRDSSFVNNYTEGVRILGAANEWAGVFLGTNGTASGLIATQWNLNKTASDTFRISRGSTSSSLLEILNNGNVGIGATNPSEKLEVNGNAIIGNHSSNHSLTIKSQNSLGVATLYFDNGAYSSDLLWKGYIAVSGYGDTSMRVGEGLNGNELCIHGMIFKLPRDIWGYSFRNNSDNDIAYLSYLGKLTTKLGYVVENGTAFQFLKADGSLDNTAYLPLSGGTMTGALNFKNATWNKVGDDVYIGDCNVGGMLGIKGAYSDYGTGFAMYNTAGTLLGKLYASGTNLYWSDNLILTSNNYESYINSSLYEANLKWGGKNYSDGFSPLDASLIDNLGPNRFAFLSYEGITVEYSTDSGVTWTDYGLNAQQKVNLLSGNYLPIVIGHNTETDATINRLSHLVRVVITTSKCTIYTQLHKFAMFITSYGLGCYCRIDARLQQNVINNVDTWKVFSDSPISGWSGWNIINTDYITTYGNTAGTLYGQVRFTFYITSLEGRTRGLTVHSILGYGGLGWTTASNMARTGHLYSYDGYQNATFPAGITATSFSGPLTGNVTGIASGNLTDISYDSTNRILKLTKNGTTTNVVTFGTNAFSSLDYLPLSGGTLGSSSATWTELRTLSSAATLRLLSYSDGCNYILSGNSAFNDNANLKITGYLNTTGNSLYLKFANIYCRGSNYTNIDSGNYSSYALPLSGGTLTGTLISRDIRPSANVSYSLGTSSYYYNYVYGKYFVKNGSSDSYVLLGGGGHKAVSDFAPNNVATLSSSGMGNSDLWTLVFEQSYPASHWYEPIAMFYVKGGTVGCGILCFYNYWNSATKLNAYEKEVWFFGAGKSETSATFGGTNRDINDYLRIYIDTANFKYYIYYNRYNDRDVKILELLFFESPDPLHSSFFTNSTTVVNLPTESSTLVRVPIKTTYNHDRTIKTSKSIYASSFYENSDIRLKENIQRIDLSDLTKLVDLVQFNFKDSDTKKYGVIAQLLELVGLQNLVYENDGKKAVDYISLLVLEIQRLRNEIGELKLEINKKS